AEPGQAHLGATSRCDRLVDVEARGGVRPGAREGRDRQVVGAASGWAWSRSWLFGAPHRERFEGEHPFVCWSPGCDGEIPNAGYAPSEYRLKRWPQEALSGAWCPRLSGDHNPGWKVESGSGPKPDRDASDDSSSSFPSRGLTCQPTSAIAGVGSRPSQPLPRARGGNILLTTHFSGADEAGQNGASPLISVFCGRDTR